MFPVIYSDSFFLFLKSLRLKELLMLSTNILSFDMEDNLSFLEGGEAMSFVKGAHTLWCFAFSVLMLRNLRYLVKILQ